LPAGKLRKKILKNIFFASLESLKKDPHQNGKFVIIKYDKNSSQNMQRNSEKNQVSSKKSAKTNLCKKPAKLFTLSRAAGDYGVVTSVEMF
jgi:hypothetical protein